MKASMSKASRLPFVVFCRNRAGRRIVTRAALAVLLVTGYSELQEAVPPGLVHFPKPFALGTLARAMEECLDNRIDTGAQILRFAPR
jgi:hypothetical protein